MGEKNTSYLRDINTFPIGIVAQCRIVGGGENQLSYLKTTEG